MMKLHVSLAAAVILIATAAALWSGRTGFAQEEGEGDRPRGGGGAIFIDSDPHADLSEAVRKKIKLHAGNEMFHVRFAGPPQDAMRKAAEELRDADGDEATEKAREKLTELLDEYFEEDMSRREQELKDVEARLEKLRTQLERRRDKKQDIIDLQVQVAVYDADGLGMFNGPGGHGPHVWGLSTYPTPPIPPQPPARAMGRGLPARPARPAAGGYPYGPRDDGPRDDGPRDDGPRDRGPRAVK